MGSTGPVRTVPGSSFSASVGSASARDLGSARGQSCTLPEASFSAWSDLRQAALSDQRVVCIGITTMPALLSALKAPKASRPVVTVQSTIGGASMLP